MTPFFRLVLHYTMIVVGSIALAFFLLTLVSSPPPKTESVSQITSHSEPATTSLPAVSATTTPVVNRITKITQVQIAESVATTAEEKIDDSVVGQVARIQNPYSFPRLSPADLNTNTRNVLVNIFCSSSGSISPVSGSGVIIDSRGVVLTNAHVAQYVLLSENPAINLACTLRTGSPAKDTWKARVLYIPPIWVTEHVAELNTSHPQGTGEHDYALLLIMGTSDGSPPPSQFPYLPYDAREAVGFAGDEVLVASYPAEFIKGLATINNLYAASSFTTVNKLLTFKTGSVDAISLHGVIGAQGGSSGGAVVNLWGRLIGLITTTSDEATTAARNLNALSLTYISRDLEIQTGDDLATVLEGDLAAKKQTFDTNVLPALMNQYVARIKAPQY